MKSIALWDGDSLIWRFGWIDTPIIAIRNLDKFITATHKKLQVDDGMFFIGDTKKSNFRYKLNKDYKAQRKGKPRPPTEMDIRKFLQEEYRAIVVKGAEVDDALGITQCFSYSKTRTVILSNDKDLDMIPGWHYDLDFHREVNYKDGKHKRKAYKKKQLYKVTDPGFLSLRRNGKRTVLVGSGQLWFCAQLLLGDTADNILGYAKLSGKRFGPVAAYKTLKHCKTFEQAFKICYTKYIEIDKVKEFKINCRLLWIKRKHGAEQIYPPSWVK